MPGDGSIGEQGGLNCVRGRLPKKLQVTRPDYRHAEIESLAYVTSPLLERLQLGGRLHTLRPVNTNPDRVAGGHFFADQGVTSAV
jgi:hypothetical protein